MVPKECKHCGLHATWHIDDDTVFACGTIYAGRGDYWNQSTGCVEIMQSRERIKKAVEVLERGQRFVDYTVSGEALEILRGNSPAGDRGLASRLLPDLAMILMGSRVGKTKCIPWLNVCRELGLTLKDLTDEIKRQGETNDETE